MQITLNIPTEPRFKIGDIVQIAIDWNDPPVNGCYGTVIEICWVCYSIHPDGTYNDDYHWEYTLRIDHYGEYDFYEQYLQKVNPDGNPD